MIITRRQRRHHKIRTRVHGTPVRPRASVFRSARRVVIQLIDDTAGKTLVAAQHAKAAAAGEELAKKALVAGIKQVVFDRGGYRYHGRVKAVAEAMRAGGLQL